MSTRRQYLAERARKRAHFEQRQWFEGAGFGSCQDLFAYVFSQDCLIVKLFVDERVFVDCGASCRVVERYARAQHEMLFLGVCFLLVSGSILCRRGRI